MKLPTKLIIGIVLFVSLVGIGFVVLRERADQLQQRLQPMSSSSSLRASLEISPAVTVGQHTKLVIRRTDPNFGVPSVFTLKLNYDPRQLKVEDIKAGPIWESSNEFEKSIDDSKGIVTYSVGQNFGAKTTTSDVLAEVSVVVLKKSQSKPTYIHPDSFAMKIGSEQKYNFEALPLKLN